MVGRLRINRARTGEIFFARTNAVNGYIGYAPRFMVWRCLMVGRLRTNRARRGEIYFARTSVVRRRVAGARSKRVGNCASIADGRKIFRPYKYSVLLNLAGAINGRGDECQWDIEGVRATGIFFARAWAGWI